MFEAVAVVVGLCAHGLAIVRGLHSAGIRVIAIEASSALPGTRTCAAEVRFVDGINGPDLLRSLNSVAAGFSDAVPLVLILTSDSMVQTVGDNVDSLSEKYRISWQICRNQVLPLLRKDEIQKRSEVAGVPYPQSVTISTEAELNAAVKQLHCPLVLKPSKPLSAYKALLFNSEDHVSVAWGAVKSSLPTIVQEFVAGGEDQIFFAAMYLDHGHLVARFEGRKLRSRPMGHTTVAISEPNDEVHWFARKFFDGLELSGYVSLEAKRDPHGRLWVIEPTVSRIDFWIGLCISDGVNFPLIEYLHQSREQCGKWTQQGKSLWINGERDPFALTWLVFNYPTYMFRFKIYGVYFATFDMRPFIYSARVSIRDLFYRIIRRLTGGHGTHG